MRDSDVDAVASFYDRHPYPPPVGDLDAYARQVADPAAARVAHVNHETEQ